MNSLSMNGSFTINHHYIPAPIEPLRQILRRRRKLDHGEEFHPSGAEGLGPWVRLGGTMMAWLCRNVAVGLVLKQGCLKNVTTVHDQCP